MPIASAIIAPVQWVASACGSVSVRPTTRSATSMARGGTLDRVFSRSKPSMPSSAKPYLPAPNGGLLLLRLALDLHGAQVIGRQVHDRGSPDVLLRGLRSRMITSTRRRSDGLSVIQTPERLAYAKAPGNPAGFNRQT